jgi:hypothetical protein
MRLRKTTGVPGAAPGGHTWDSDTDEVEVPDDLAAELLAIPGGGFAEVEVPTADSETPPEDAGADSPAEGLADAKTAAKPRQTRTPRKTPVDE